MNRFALAIASVGLLGISLAPTARADEWNKRTILTVNEPIQVPGQVMEPGKYVMKLLDSPSNRHIVQIFNEDETHLITTILAIPNYRLEPTGKTQFSFWETPPGQPKALRAWFYPGDNFGQEFAYPKTMAVSIATATHSYVPTTTAETQTQMTTAQVGTVNENGEEKAMPEQQQEVAQSTPPPSAPAAEPAPEADRLQTPPPASDTLPHTSSPMPLIGLAGMLSLLGYVALRLARS
jgi:hypothetical protein